MTKIIFLCHGNICRSSMAEFVMKDLVEKAGLSGQFEIASAATSTEEIGNPVYPPAWRKLAEHGISCAGKTARQMTRRDYETYEALAADPEVEAIYIATPNALHYENCKLCLEQGKHVLCEKPFTIDPEQAQQLYRLAEEKHLFLMEAFWIWLLPLYDRLREILILKTGIMLSSGMRRHIFFCPEAWYTLHIDAPEGGTEMKTEKVYAMPFAKIYPMLVAKTVRKGRTQAEVDEMIGWLTGYSAPQIEAAVQNGTLYGDFFRDAPQLNPDRVLIKGSVCGVKLESIEEPLMKEIRYLDKLVDELAKGKAMEKIKRTNK